PVPCRTSTSSVPGAAWGAIWVRQASVVVAGCWAAVVALMMSWRTPAPCPGTPLMLICSSGMSRRADRAAMLISGTGRPGRAEAMMARMPAPCCSTWRSTVPGAGPSSTAACSAHQRAARSTTAAAGGSSSAAGAGAGTAAGGGGPASMWRAAHAGRTAQVPVTQVSRPSADSQFGPPAMASQPSSAHSPAPGVAYMALAVALVMPRGRRARRVASPAVVVRAAAARPGRAMPGSSMPAAPRAAPARVAARPVTSWMREMRRRAPWDQWGGLPGPVGGGGGGGLPDQQGWGGFGGAAVLAAVVGGGGAGGGGHLADRRGQPVGEVFGMVHGGGGLLVEADGAGV